jgi:hypothetical protein
MSLQNLPGVESYSGSKTEATFNLYFDVAAATLNEVFGHNDFELKVGQIPEHRRWRGIGLTLQYGYNQTTHIAGVKLKDMAGGCQIVPRKDDQGSTVPVGTLTYTPAFERNGDMGTVTVPAHYHLALSIPENHFNELVMNLRAGRLPTNFKIQIRGFVYRGLEHLWDVNVSPVVPVISFSHSFVAAVDYSISTKDEPFTKTVEPSYYPATRADFVTLLELTKAQAEQTQRIAEKLAWATGGFICLVAVIVWRLLAH